MYVAYKAFVNPETIVHHDVVGNLWELPSKRNPKLVSKAKTSNICFYFKKGIGLVYMLLNSVLLYVPVGV